MSLASEVRGFIRQWTHKGEFTLHELAAAMGMAPEDTRSLNGPVNNMVLKGDLRKRVRAPRYGNVFHKPGNNPLLKGYGG